MTIWLCAFFASIAVILFICAAVSNLVSRELMWEIAAGISLAIIAVALFSL